MIRKMQEEDLAAKKEEQRKRDINKLFMQNAFKERELLKKKEAEYDKLQEEDIKKYNEQVALREKNLAKKKNDLQQQKDKIFNKLCDEEAKRKAEQDYWDNIRKVKYFLIKDWIFFEDPLQFPRLRKFIWYELSIKNSFIVDDVY